MFCFFFEMTAAGDIDGDDDYDGCTLGSQTHPLSITQHPLIKVHRSQRIDCSAIVIVNPTAKSDRRCGLKQKKPGTMAIDVLYSPVLKSLNNDMCNICMSYILSWMNNR